MPAEFVPAPVEIYRLMPELLLAAGGTLLMLLSLRWRNREASRFPALAMAILSLALLAAAFAHGHAGPAFNRMMLVDDFSTFLRILVISAAMLAVLASPHYLRQIGAESGEYYALILFSTAGQSWMASSVELVMLFLGLEISSISTYILAGYLRDDLRASEAALKYFLLGSFATAFLLYGIAWTYGLAGSTFLPEIRDILRSSAGQISPALLALASGLIFVGLAFKVSAWPFQVWTPDVYQGAPAPVTAFLSTGPKAAAFALLLRVFMTGFGPMASGWQPLAWVTALFTMVIGNFAALTQTNVKRLLAYSSIAHAGYVLVGVTSGNSTGMAAVLFYLAAYVLMSLGAFAVVIYLAGPGERFVRIQDYSGLSSRQPMVAALFSLFLLSLIGVPLTAGFFAKFYVFKAALDSDLVWLTLLGLLNSAVAAYYYLRLIVVMYMQEPAADSGPLHLPARSLQWTLYLCAAGTLLLGLFPSLVLSPASSAASGLFQLPAGP